MGVSLCGRDNIPPPKQLFSYVEVLMRAQEEERRGASLVARPPSEGKAHADQMCTLP